MTEDRPYTDSPVVTRTVRAVVPFVLTYGAFTMLHGTKSVGGGFQGGVVVSTAVVALGFAFGVDQTARVAGRGAVLALAAGGLTLIGVVAGGSLLLGGGFLDAGAYATVPVADAVVYAVELVEIGIGLAVAGVVATLFFALSGGGR